MRLGDGPEIIAKLFVAAYISWARSCPYRRDAQSKVEPVAAQPMLTPKPRWPGEVKQTVNCPDTGQNNLQEDLSEQQLRQMAEKYARMIHASPDAITVRSLPERRYIEINEGFTKLTGYLPEEVIGKTPRELGLWVDTQPHETTRDQLESQGRVRAEEFRFRTKAGEIRWGSVSAVRVKLDGQECMLAVTHDITDRKDAEDAVRRSEADLRSLVEGAPYGIYRVTVDGRILMANPAMAKMLGYESQSELLELNMATDVYREAASRTHLIEDYWKKNDFREVEVEWKRKDGKVISVRLTGKPISKSGTELDYFEVFAEDITDRLSLERQLLQSQKMDAIGRLAGGVAHDFNNLLNVILGHTEILEMKLAGNEGVLGGLEAIGQAGERAAVLTRQLLTFSRKQLTETKKVDLNAAVREIEKLVRRVIGEDIKLTLRLEPDLGSVQINPGQLDQVLMNLVVNAREAMPSGGKLVLGTANVELDGTYVRQHLGVASGHYVVLAVSDTGTGMSAETMSHIFEPFFTTKEKGKGTGLGLSTVYGIVKQAGGYIVPYSEEGHGTTFKIYFPHTDQSAQAPVAVRLTDKLPGGTETILVVEDEKALRDLTERILVDSGYQVLVAADVHEALEIAGDGRTKLDLLLTDVVMPTLSGNELAKRVAAFRPDLPVLYMSGYADDVILNRGALDAAVELIQKPFTRRTLLTRIRVKLNRHKAMKWPAIE
jgi:two-component system cell cycle sensor histidine kinase/response regulator CckA